jgi:hypothetical protein
MFTRQLLYHLAKPLALKKSFAAAIVERASHYVARFDLELSILLPNPPPDSQLLKSYLNFRILASVPISSVIIVHLCPGFCFGKYLPEV